MSHSWTLQEAHVDWLTCTAPTGDGGPRLLDLGTELLDESRTRGNTVRPSNFEGYHGNISEGIFAGFRLDGTCLRLSGRMARDWWRRVVEQGRNVTRLDLALTALGSPPEPHLALQSWNAIPEGRSTGGHPTDYTLIQTRNRGETLYCGVRASERFGRLYDKYRESKGVWRDGSWRYEVEYKGQAAKDVSSYLRDNAANEARIVGLLRRRFNEWGVEVVVAEPGIDWREGPIPSLTDDESRMKWLKSQVRQSIERIGTTFTADEIRTALGLQFGSRQVQEPGAKEVVDGATFDRALAEYRDRQRDKGGRTDDRDWPEPDDGAAGANGSPVPAGPKHPSKPPRRGYPAQRLHWEADPDAWTKDADGRVVRG